MLFRSYTGQELISEYLPDLPVPPEEYRKILVEREERRKNGNGQAGNHFWANVLIGLRTRCEDLKKLRQKPGIHREELVFIYGTAFFPVHSDITQGEFIDALLEFNAGFPNPLTTKEVKTS